MCICHWEEEHSVAEAQLWSGSNSTYLPTALLGVISEIVDMKAL